MSDELHSRGARVLPQLFEHSIQLLGAHRPKARVQLSRAARETQKKSEENEVSNVSLRPDSGAVQEHEGCRPCKSHHVLVEVSMFT
jgi:hypothetical protein